MNDAENTRRPRTKGAKRFKTQRDCTRELGIIYTEAREGKLALEKLSRLVNAIQVTSGTISKHADEEIKRTELRMKQSSIDLEERIVELEEAGA